MTRPNQGVSLTDGGVLFQRSVPPKGFEVRGWGGEPVVIEACRPGLSWLMSERRGNKKLITPCWDESVWTIPPTALCLTLEPRHNSRQDTTLTRFKSPSPFPIIVTLNVNDPLVVFIVLFLPA